MNPLRNTDFRRAGFWLNYETSKVLEVADHLVWVTNPVNAVDLGVPAEAIQALARARVRHGDDARRRKVLLFVLGHAPVMRIRGHGDHIAFEYAAVCPGDEARAFRAVRRFCSEAGVGAGLTLKVVNLSRPGSTWQGNTVRLAAVARGAAGGGRGRGRARTESED